MQQVKLSWKRHELIFVTVSGLILLCSYLYNISLLSAKDISLSYGNAFSSNHVPFSLYKNVILPDLLPWLFVYLAYLCVNLFLLPRLVETRQLKLAKNPPEPIAAATSGGSNTRSMSARLLWTVSALAVIIIILGLVFDIATYFHHEWQFHYPGFSIFFNENNPNSQFNIGEGFGHATLLVLAYSLYLSIRELTVRFIQGSRQNVYNALISNRVTAFIAQFCCLLIALWAFRIVVDPRTFVAMVLFIPSFFAMFISNVYWLFPKVREGGLFNKRMLSSVVLSSMIYSTPSVFFFYPGQLLSGVLLTWLMQLLVITPLTWIYYKRNEDEILQLRVIEKALVKSKADLQLLRSQINPHFLFNTLNTLYGTALQERADRTANGIQMLGDMMRFMLHENSLDFIDMEKELDYLRNYLALQKLRTQTSPMITINDTIPDSACDHKIAPMLLIPFVENAFKHGISLKQPSWINIDLRCDDSMIQFEVRNSMHARPDDQIKNHSSGIGYNNVVERLRLIYGEHYKLTVHQDEREYRVKLIIHPSFSPEI